MPKYEPSRLRDYTDEDILREINRVAFQFFGGRCPTIKEFDRHSRVHSATVRQHFGSWANGIEQAGFQYSRRILATPDNEKEILDDLNKFKEKFKGRYFGKSAYVENGGKYSPDGLLKFLQCKNWPALLMKVLGLSRTAKKIVIVAKQPKKPPSDAELFSELKRVWDQIGRQPTRKEFCCSSKIAVAHYWRRFGNWTNSLIQFCARARYPIGHIQSPLATREQHLDEIRIIASKAGNPAVFDFATYKKHGGMYSQSTFQHQFGSWTKAVELVGLKDGRSRQHFSNEDFFAELQRIWELLGRQPTSKEMKRHGSKMSPQSFQVRFGSWLKAIHAFCEDRNGEAINENLSENQGVLAIGQEFLDNAPNTTITRPQRVVHRTSRKPSLRLEWKVKQRDNFRCCACGRSPATELGIVLHVDHIVAWANGGETTLDNLQTLCSKCNLGKSDTI